MRPVLFHIGSFPVYSYSAMVVLAYLASLLYALAEAKRLKFDYANVIDLSLVFFVFGILGARLLFVIVDYQRFIADPREIYRVWNGGLVFYGGLAGAVTAAAVYIKRRRLPLGKWADLTAPTAMTTLVFGRIGCLLNGCCYGKVAAGLPWGIVYPASHPALGLHRYPVHPTPVYSSLAALLIFIVLAVMERHKRFDGQVFWSMILMYSASRFIIEFFRGDPRGMIPGLGLSTSQGIAVLGALSAGIILFRLFRKNPESSTP